MNVGPHAHADQWPCSWIGPHGMRTLRREILDLRYRLLQSGEAFFGDLGVCQSEALQFGENVKMLEAGVGDGGFVESQYFQVGQLLQMDQPGVGDFRLAERQPGELRQVLEMRE